MELLPDEMLERSGVVANCRMNRDRVLTGTNGYAHDLKFNPIDFLHERIQQNGTAGWLDLCCGAGNALAEASRAAEEAGIGRDLAIVGVDLVGMFGAAARERENRPYGAARYPDGSRKPRAFQAACRPGDRGRRAVTCRCGRSASSAFQRPG